MAKEKKSSTHPTLCKDQVFFNIAREIGSLSNCISLQVGAIIVKEGRILSTGYNGSPAGYIHCNEVHHERGHEHTAWSNKYEIHAEMNAILFAARNGIQIQESTIYSVVQPCWQCSKNIVQSGIKEVIYQDKYYQLSVAQQREMNEFFKDNNVNYTRYLK